jgi:hypothetical protein
MGALANNALQSVAFVVALVMMVIAAAVVAFIFTVPPWVAFRKLVGFICDRSSIARQLQWTNLLEQFS